MFTLKFRKKKNRVSKVRTRDGTTNSFKLKKVNIFHIFILIYVSKMILSIKKFIKVLLRDY